MVIKVVCCFRLRFVLVFRMCIVVKFIVMRVGWVLVVRVNFLVGFFYMRVESFWDRVLFILLKIVLVCGKVLVRGLFILIVWFFCLGKMNVCVIRNGIFSLMNLCGICI